MGISYLTIQSSQNLINFEIINPTFTFIMKYYAALALFAAGAHADAGAALNTEVDRQRNEDPEPFKSVSVMLGDDAFAAINGYGCWCHFNENHGKGKGAPVDGVDAICKNLQAAYDCAMMDYAEATGNDDCVPWEVEYNAGMSFGIGALVDNCNALNTELCAQYACMAEGAFVINIIA